MKPVLASAQMMRKLRGTECSDRRRRSEFLDLRQHRLDDRGLRQMRRAAIRSVACLQADGIEAALRSYPDIPAVVFFGRSQ
jgi:hypothetical protein